ncbi:MAG: phosphoribosylformylglycinamidine cyclo-ligase [Saprospiraceae bacterium]|nr:phosphoribosylformylglycinamidine cyclo-ligase [Saprospiraceae bacterium]
MSKPISYKDAGVDKEEGYRSVELMKAKVAKTHNENVLSGLGSFGAFYALKNYENPVLVSGTDGVGTKLKVAFDTKRYDTVGIDCVAMCVNDILCHGAEPLFFLDYLACGQLDAEVAATLVGGIADGCEQAGAALIGGETAEMPGFYKPGDYDIAGFAVGAVERNEVINGANVAEGDVIIAIPSSGIHSNGFSLVRKVLPDFYQDFQGQPLHETLLQPTKIYVKSVLDVIAKHEVHGLAHITGGGLIENVPRALNPGTSARIQKNNIRVLPIFQHIIDQGVAESEMWGTFNMGVGFVIIAPEPAADDIISILAQHGENAYIIGDVIQGQQGIELV